MDHIIRISEGALREVLTHGAPQGRPAGLSRRSGRTEWLVQRAEGRGAGTVRIVPAARGLEIDAVSRAWIARPNGPRALLFVGTGGAGGHCAGLARDGGEEGPVCGLRLVAPGLPFAGPTDPKDDPRSVKSKYSENRGATRQLPFSHGQSESDLHIAHTPEQPFYAPEEVWSRTIGALGEHAWRQLAALPVCIIGCGRTGSLAAAAFGRLGVHRLALIDPDRVEPHNLGEMEARAADLGARKANVVAEGLFRSAACEAPEVETVAEGVLSLSALQAVKASELVVCAVDNAAARLAAAYLATAYLRPLLDLGTGILAVARSGGGPELAARRMGLDARLVLPGHCLLCTGGIAGLGEGIRRLLAPEPVPAADWRRERAGSLRSLNALAAGLGVRLWEDLVAGRLRGTTWLRLDYNSGGLPSLEVRQPEPVEGCPLCALAGRGDEAVAQFHGFLEAM